MGGGAGNPAIFRETVANPDLSDESDTETSKEKFPELVGVPVIAPVVLLRLKPAGSPLTVQK